MFQCMLNLLGGEVAVKMRFKVELILFLGNIFQVMGCVWDRAIVVQFIRCVVIRLVGYKTGIVFIK